VTCGCRSVSGRAGVAVVAKIHSRTDAGRGEGASSIEYKNDDKLCVCTADIVTDVVDVLDFDMVVGVRIAGVVVQVK